MPLRIGIVGLPNVGKSTLFNALTKSRAAQAANYPFCTIDPNVGVVEVPDERLTTLTEIVQPEKVIPATVEFVDIAGLVKGASKGEGLGNAFLSHIREVDAIAQVVRLFPGDGVIHVDGSVDPKRDRETIETELMLADFDALRKRKDKVQGGARTGNKEAIAELAVVDNLLSALEQGKPASSVPFDKEQDALAHSFQLLTKKPMLYACNVSEEQLGTLKVEDVKSQLGIDNALQVVLICAKVEEDLQNLSPEETAEFLCELGIKSSGLDQLIQVAYGLLGYITYFTAGPKEVRAWTITKGSTAPQAAGIIHTDFEKGFIRGETISYKDFVQFGDELKAKEAGKMRAEGKEYIVADGDIMHFRFNV